jgi:peptidoglycan hydrolase-like protein with peptidoglycan-binding domain
MLEYKDMKKYSSILFVFILFIFMFVFNSNSASALVAGCTETSLYSATTGAACGTTSAVMCPTGDVFSTATGQPCTAWQASSAGVLLKRELAVGMRGDDVKAIQQILKDAGFLAGKVDGIFGPITKSAVARYQQVNSITATGKVDAVTVQKINTLPSVVRIPGEPCIPMMGINGVTTSNCKPTPVPTPCPLVSTNGIVTHLCPPEPVPLPVPLPAPCDLISKNGVLGTAVCPPREPLTPITPGTTLY